MTVPRIPVDDGLERQVLGAVLGRWLIVPLEPAWFWNPRHRRIAAAIGDTTAIRFGYEVRDGRVAGVVTGLDLDDDDAAYAGELAAGAPVCTPSDVARLEDLATRRRIVDACADAHEAALTDPTTPASELVDRLLVDILQ
jgi:hypothetical protein